MAFLGLGQEAPLQFLILAISLAERQGGFGLHQLVAEVKRVRGIGDLHEIKQFEGIGAAEERIVVQSVDQAVLGEDPPVWVSDPPLELGKVLETERFDLHIAQHDQPRFDVLGECAANHGMMHQPARRSISRTDDLAQLITAVVSTLRTASS